MADDLEISEQTVKDYLSNIYAKVGVENRFALASFLLNSPALQHGETTESSALPE
ncbi:MAG: LuxR C-terminal-related transcriptional regulator [Thermodesulfovibrionales bacterium]